MTVLDNLGTDTDDTEMDDGIACVKMTPVRDDLWDLGVSTPVA